MTIICQWRSEAALFKLTHYPPITCLCQHSARAWGHQIRSYVLQPYQMVKDLRTGVSTSNTGAVLDGDLDEFMQAALAQKAFGTEPEAVEDVD